MNARTKSTIAHEDENQIGEDREVTLSSDLTLEQICQQLNGNNDIVLLDEVSFGSQAENLAFMEEKVLVHVFTSVEKNAEKIVDVYNDGIPQRFIRGQWQVVKRKYVEVLARAKPFSVETPETTDANGDRTTKIQTTNGMRYPFEMKDSNPRGAAWLQSVLAQP